MCVVASPTGRASVLAIVDVNKSAAFSAWLSQGSAMDREMAMLLAVAAVASRLPVMDDPTTTLCASIAARLIGGLPPPLLPLLLLQPLPVSLLQPPPPPSVSPLVRPARPPRPSAHPPPPHTHPAGGYLQLFDAQAQRLHGAMLLALLQVATQQPARLPVLLQRVVAVLLSHTLQHALPGDAGEGGGSPGSACCPWLTARPAAPAAATMHGPMHLCLSVCLPRARLTRTRALTLAASAVAAPFDPNPPPPRTLTCAGRLAGPLPPSACAWWYYITLWRALLLGEGVQPDAQAGCVVSRATSKHRARCSHARAC